MPPIISGLLAMNCFNNTLRNLWDFAKEFKRITFTFVCQDSDPLSSQINVEQKFCISLSCLKMSLLLHKNSSAISILDSKEGLRFK